MSEQQIIVEIEGLGELEFPDGTDPAVIQATVKRLTSQQTPEHPHARVARLAQEHLPSIGGAIGGLVGLAGGPLVAAGIAGLGGAAGRIAQRGIEAIQGRPEPAQGMVEDAAGDAALQGGVSLLGGAVGSGVSAVGGAISRRAVPLVRSAMKPVWAEVRRRAGIEGTMPAAVANKQAQFILDKGLRTPEQADSLVKSLGSRIDERIAAAEANPRVSPVLDTATRIPRYLNATLRRVEKQSLPGKDRTAIQNVGRELVEDSPLSQPAPTVKPKKQDFNTSWNETTKPFDAPKPLPNSSRPRALRANVRPSEGMETVRTKSFFDKDAKAGEVAGGKAIERAVRDSIKESVPSTRPLLREQGRAMDARTLLDRSSWRDANRDTAGMGTIAGLANGRPLIALLLQGMKEGQLAAGHAAAKYGPKITRAGVPTGQTMEQLTRALLISMLNEQE